MPTMQCRIDVAHARSLESIILTLAGGIPGSLKVLAEWAQVDPTAPLAFLTCVDLKHLYDEHIWSVYELCDRDIQRFIYHVEMELPDQDTGSLAISGPYISEIDEDTFFAKRKFGKPGSYWALQHPPTEKDYAYPIP